MTRAPQTPAIPPGAFVAPMLCFGVLLGLNSWAGSLYSSDDVIYAQMARESLEAGRFMAFTWLDAVIFEKPPLLFWLLQISGGALGWTEFAVRLPGIIASAVTLGYVALLARRVCPGAPGTGAWLAPLICVATVGFTLNARRPLTDPLLTAAVVAMVYYGCRIIADAEPRAAWKLGLATGLGVLAKWVAVGPTVVAVGLCLLLARRWRAIGVAWTVAVVVAAPWHLLMTLSHGSEFWDAYAGYHVLDRVRENLTGSLHTTYYIETLVDQDGLLGMALLGLLPLGLWRALRGRGIDLGLILGVIALEIVAVQLSSTRLYHYLMPLFPLTAVVAVAALGPWLGRPSVRGVTLVGVAACFFWGPFVHLADPDYAPESRSVATRVIAPLAQQTRLIVWESYDPAIFYYGGRVGEIWTTDRRFYDIQQSVDMMRRSRKVIWADEEATDALLADPRPIVILAPAARQASLQPLIAAADKHRVVQGRVEGDFVVVSIAPRKAL